MYRQLIVWGLRCVNVPVKTWALELSLTKTLKQSQDSNLGPTYRRGQHTRDLLLPITLVS